jgi:hypothetical protein
MRLIMHVVTFVFLVSGVGLAEETWSGYMVNSPCYEAAHRNTRSTSTVDRDMNLAIKHCAPNPQTKSFGVVEKDWQIIAFDAAGNAKAAELLGKIEKQKMYRITVTGHMDQNILKVDSISMAQ